MRRYLGEIKRLPSGCYGLPCWRDSFMAQYPLIQTMGRVLPGDAGKAAWMVGDIVQVENDEQRNVRMDRFVEGISMNHERAERLVRNEVYVSLSSLVYALNKGYGIDSFNHKTVDYAEELSALVEQAFELASPVLDYEEAARQEGWRLEDGVFKRGADQDSGAKDWEELCYLANLDPYEREVFEHWAVSQALADDLEAVGEKVDKDFANMCVWARTTTGQAISMDACIQRVLELHDKRLGREMDSTNVRFLQEAADLSHPEEQLSSPVS